MRELLLFVIIAFIGLFLVEYCESKRKPDELGMHSTYQVVCENGFKYKVLSGRGGVIMLLNSDGTPVKCNQTRY